jgi:L-cysteine/cystine lyase
MADTAGLAASDAMVLFDGAQGLGAVPTRVDELGCDFYAASGQKWLCGPDGSGYLYARRELADELDPPWPGYTSLADASRPSDLIAHPGARRFDIGFSGPMFAWALASLEVLGGFGWEHVYERAAGLAELLAAGLADRGRDVAPRERTTLVSWHSDDAEAESKRLAESGVLVRFLPGRGLVRASVGAWSSEGDLERLLALV